MGKPLPAGEVENGDAAGLEDASGFPDVGFKNFELFNVLEDNKRIHDIDGLVVDGERFAIALEQCGVRDPAGVQFRFDEIAVLVNVHADDGTEVAGGGSQDAAAAGTDLERGEGFWRVEDSDERGGDVVGEVPCTAHVSGVAIGGTVKPRQELIARRGRSFANFLAEAHDVRAGFDFLSDGHETAINSFCGEKSTNIRRRKS